MKTTITMFKTSDRDEYICPTGVSSLMTCNIGDIVSFKISGELIHTELSRVVRPAGATTRCTGCFWYMPHGRPSCRGLSDIGNSICLYLRCDAVFKSITTVMEEL